MATITTVRPSSTQSAVGWSASAGFLHEATSDNSDGTYAEWSGDGSAMILGTPASSPPSGEQRHAVRVRARGSQGMAWWAARLFTGQLISGASGSFPSSPTTINGSWGTSGIPHTGSTVFSCYVTGQSDNVRIVELYLDIDTRLAPTFTIQLLDGSGASSTNVSDTVTPSVRVTSLNMDGLSARQYRYWITDGSSNIVWDTGITSGPAVERGINPLENGSYTLHGMVWSTLGANTAYASDEETLAFDMNVGTITTPDPPSVTPVVGTPFYQVEVCAADNTGLDNEVSWIELTRTDCEGNVSRLALLGPLTSEQCASWIDYTAPRSVSDKGCGHEEEQCCFYYETRAVAFVDSLLVVSQIPDSPEEPETYCLDWNKSEHLLRSFSSEGPLYVGVCGSFQWTRERPFTASQGVMGSRFVTTAEPSGRNYQLSAAVRSEAELAQLRAIVKRPLVLVSPSDGVEVWAAPVDESITVIKVGRIRQVSINFVGTGPEPFPQFDDLVGA